MFVVYIVLDEVREAAFAARPAAAVPESYRPRLERMQNRAARARTQAGLWLLEQGLALADVSSGTFARLGFAPGGRPCFANGPAFSISHSEWLVACAIAEHARIGLDVEARRENVSPRLQRSIAPSGDFFDAWCAREATVKASGRVGLARIRGLELAGDIAQLDGRDWHLCPVSLQAGYASCVASERPLVSASIHTLDCADRFDLSGVPGE